MAALRMLALVSGLPYLQSPETVDAPVYTNNGIVVIGVTANQNASEYYLRKPTHQRRFLAGTSFFEDLRPLV